MLRRKLSIQLLPSVAGRKPDVSLRVASLLVLLAALALASPALAAERVTITVLGTTDIHATVSIGRINTRKRIIIDKAAVRNLHLPRSTRRGR